MRAVHGKRYRRFIEHIAVCGLLFYDFIMPERQRLRQHELACGIRIVSVQIHRRRVVDVLYDIFAGIGISYFKANSRRGDNLVGFHILFHNLDEGLKGRVVDEITVNLAVFAYKHIKGGQKLVAVPAFCLPHGICAVGQSFGFGIAVFVADKEITFAFFGGVIASRRL